MEGVCFSVLVEHYRSYYVKWPFKFVCLLFCFVHVQRPPQGFKLGRPPVRTTASIFRIRTKQFILGCPRGSTTLRAKRSRTAVKQHEHKLRIRLQIRSPVGQIRVYTCNITFANFAKSFAKIHAWISKNICKQIGVDLQKYSAQFAGDFCCIPLEPNAYLWSQQHQSVVPKQQISTLRLP